MIHGQHSCVTYYNDKFLSVDILLSVMASYLSKETHLTQPVPACHILTLALISCNISRCSHQLVLVCWSLCQFLLFNEGAYISMVTPLRQYAPSWCESFASSPFLAKQRNVIMVCNNKLLFLIADIRDACMPQNWNKFRKLVSWLYFSLKMD